MPHHGGLYALRGILAAQGPACAHCRHIWFSTVGKGDAEGRILKDPVIDDDFACDRRETISRTRIGYFAVSGMRDRNQKFKGSLFVRNEYL